MQTLTLYICVEKFFPFEDKKYFCLPYCLCTKSLFQLNVSLLQMHFIILTKFSFSVNSIQKYHKTESDTASENNKEPLEIPNNKQVYNVNSTKKRTNAKEKLPDIGKMNSTQSSYGADQSEERPPLISSAFRRGSRRINPHYSS